MIHQLAAPLFNANGSVMLLQDVARVAKSAPWVDNTILCIYALVWASLLWPGLVRPSDASALANHAGRCIAGGPVAGNVGARSSWTAPWAVFQLCLSRLFLAFP